jgi:hypothetical protein
MKMMNERIRELAGQAGFETEHHKWIFANDNAGEGECHELLEKFAELIIRECVKVMYDNAIERKVGLEIDKRPTYYAAAILEHFGAKE